MSTEKTYVAIGLADEKQRHLLAQAVQNTEGFELAGDNAERSKTLFIIEPGEDPTEVEKLGRMLGNRSLGGVFLSAENPPSDLLIRAMRAGIDEFLPQPVSAKDFTEALSRFKMRRSGFVASPSSGKGQIIGVIGTRNGVGATTLSLNLAFELNRRMPGSTAIADFARPNSDIPLFLDQEPVYTWAEAATNLQRLDETFLMSIMTTHSSKLGILPAPPYTDSGVALSPNAAESILRTMSRTYEIVIVDLGGLGDPTALAALKFCDEVLMVMEPTLPSLAGAQRIIDSLKLSAPKTIEKIQVVMNRHTPKSEIQTGEVEKLIGKRITWKIQNDYEGTLSAINQGKPLLEASPKSPAYRDISKMARKYAQKVPSAKKGSLLSKLFGKSA